MTHHLWSCSFYIMMFVSSLSCASGPSRICADENKDVIFSISSEDMEAFDTITEIKVNNKTIFRGVIRPSKPNTYTYVATHIPPNRGAKISVHSLAATGNVRLDKKVWIKDSLWIVLTRTREPGRDAALEMSVSYEAPPR